MFPVVDVSQWQVDEVDEQLGTKEKSWLRNSSDQRWLFKQVRSAEHGEDWAEKLVQQLALHLGLPVANVDLAVLGDRRGVISQNFVPRDARLEHGNELLVRIDPDYDRDQTRRNDRYTIEAVQLALSDASPPDAYVIENLSAFDVWAGYLVLDAWVAGRDRHHENWAVIATPNGRVLAPTFDHGNALGFQETEEKHRTMSQDDAMLSRWADRGTSHHFAGRPRLVDLAHSALDAASSHTRRIWLTRLAGVSEDDLTSVISQMPPIMSAAARTFCLRLLMLNQRRLCDVR